MKKLFTNGKFFLAVTVIAALSQLIFFVGFLPRLGFGLITFIPFAQVVCEIVLYVSFKKHSKNVMKGMMGAMLMLIMLDASRYLQGNEMIIDTVLDIIYFGLVVFLFINHFVINSTRLSSKINILANQIAVVLIAITVLVLEIVAFPLYSMTIDYLFSILTIISFAGFAALVVCVESRLDAYRLDREAAGWTEEAGYPEGYVHEYQKNK